MRHSILQSFRVSVLLTVLLLSVPSYAQFYFDFGYSEDSVVYVGATTTEYTIDFQLNMDSLQEVFHSASFSIGNFSTLDLPKPYYFDYMDSVGRPMLPIRRINLEVPEGFDMDLSFSNISFTYEYFDLKYPYYPFQDIREDTINSFVYYEPSYMHSPDWTLDNEVTISPYFHFFDEKGFYVDIRPYSYDPLHNQVRVIRKMQARIPLVGNNLGNHNDLTTLHIFDWNNYIYKFRDSIGHGTPVREHILILTPEEHLTTLEDYISYREHQDFYVHTYTLEDIASEYGVSFYGLSSEIIIDKLQHIYDSFSRKPKYLILVGDKNVIPYASGIPLNIDNPPTDFGYSLPTTSLCLTMRLAVGRWPIELHGSSQLQNIIANIKRFEKITAEYQRKIDMRVDVVAGSGDHEDDFYDGAHNILSCLDNYATYLYDGRGKNSCELYDLIKWDLQNHLWMLIYRGHGWGHGLDSSLCISDDFLHRIDQLQYQFPPMIFTFACLTNASTFGEKWLTYYDSPYSYYGAASFFGSTTISYSYYNNLYSQRIFNNFKFSHLGDILVCGTQKFYFFLFPWRENHYKRYVLMGDPVLFVKGSPRTQPLTIMQRQDNSLENNAINNAISTEEMIMIFTANGQLVQQTNKKENINNLPTGMYYIVTYRGNEITTQKIIIP